MENLHLYSHSGVQIIHFTFILIVLFFYLANTISFKKWKSRSISNACVQFYWNLFLFSFFINIKSTQLEYMSDVGCKGMAELHDFAWDEESFFLFFSFFFFFLQHQKGVALELIRYCNIIHNKTDRTKVNGRKLVIRETAAIPIKIIKLWHCMFFTAGHRLAVKEISILSNVENAECIGVDYRVLI